MKARLFVVLVVLSLGWPANWSAIAQSSVPLEKGSTQEAVQLERGVFDPFADPMFGKEMRHPGEIPALFPVATEIAATTDNEFPPADDLSRTWVRTSDGAFVKPDGKILSATPMPLAVEAAAPTATGGPDDFGYTWDDSVPFRWVDATVGTDTGLSQGAWGASVTAPIDLGFPFKFYENTYTSIYISTAGAVSFVGSNLSGATSTPYVPTPATPNNFIAPYLAPLRVNSGVYTGRVYYLRGGAVPNRYMVVEWYQARDDIDGQFTFEVILYENGNIEFSYQSMAHGRGYYCSTAAAIEDASGYDGLAYRQSGCNNMNSVSGKTVRFQRPGTAARVGVYPPYQGRFTRAGEVVVFQTAIRNTGELGADTFDLALSSFWPTTLYAADGMTPLPDTDGDGAPDTGPVPQGGTATVVVKVTTPAGVQVGAHNTATITARSSLNPAKMKSLQLQTAVPAPFAQVYRDDADGAMTLYLAQPAGQAARKASADNYYGYDQAVAETPSGNFVYAWRRGRSVASVYVYELEYTLLDRYGATVRPISRLTDHSSATMSTYDNVPALAVTPDGRIGVLWYRYLYNNSTGQSNYNIYFAVLDASGNVVVPPTNLTNNNVWGGWNDLNVPRFYDPRIAATGDNHFVLAWTRQHQESAGSAENVYYAAVASDGNQIKPPAQLTRGVAGGTTYIEPALTTLSGNRVFLSWVRREGGNDDIFFAVLDSAGNTVKAITDLSEDESVIDWGNWDVTQLSNGRILAVWEAWGCFPNEWVPRLRYAVLDASFNRVVAPRCLDKAAGAINGEVGASVVVDAAGHAILTWMDESPRRNLYYALVGSDGDVLTPPTIFRTSQATSPRIETSFTGYGNTSYSWTPPAGVDTYISSAGQVNGTIGGYAAVPIVYGSVGGVPANDVVVEATLAAGLAYDSDTSGVTPTTTGNRVQWNLPSLSFLEQRDFRLFLQVSSAATVGQRFPVVLNIASAGTDQTPANNSASVNVVASMPPGGPDDFGYTWDDSMPFNWIDARTGTRTSIEGDDRTGLVQIGFPFKFYGTTWEQVYISTNGILVFGQDNHGCCGNFPIPLPVTPNSVVAPFWADLTVGSYYNPGAIYTLGGGTAPNRYFVVQWDLTTQCCQSGGTDYKTFQAILYENGDIVFQYLDMRGDMSRGSIGIEDEYGLDGLKYSGFAANGKAIRFFRPGPLARIQVNSLYQGQFDRAGGNASFSILIRNTGERSIDIYDLALSSLWSATLYAADGMTPLADSDGDGAPDTGPVPQGGTATVVVKVTTPAGAQVGAHNTATITARSSLNPAKMKSVQLQTAVPASFAQVYRDDADGAMTLYLAQPAGQAARKASTNNYYGYDQAVAETPSGNFVYAWRRGRSVASVYVYELEYTLLDRYGATARPISRLTDHSSATMSTYDNVPVLAVTPDGRIGVLWYRYLYNNSTGQYNYNIYFAVLDASGNVVVPPTNLTNNNVWGGWNDLNVPRFYDPRIAATGDNRFVLAWTRQHQESGGYVTDVYYAVRSSGGAEVRGVSKLTADTPGYDESYYYPGITTLSGNRVLLCYTRSSNGDIYCGVLDSAGNVTRPPENVSGDGSASWDWLSDAVQLADGRIVVAWTGGNYPAYDTRFAVLDATFNRIAGPTALTHPAAVVGNGYVSVAADVFNRAVLTWMDYHYSYRPNLYYALIGSDGNVLTPPTIFRTAQAASPRIETSFVGYGNTSYCGWILRTYLPLVMRN